MLNAKRDYERFRGFREDRVAAWLSLLGLPCLVPRRDEGRPRTPSGVTSPKLGVGKCHEGLEPGVIVTVLAPERCR